MKVVGATDLFGRWHFIVEGLIVGVVGAVVAVLIVGFGYRPAVVNLQSVLIFVPLAFDPYYLRVVLAAMLGFGLLLGSVGSYLGVRRFLRSEEHTSELQSPCNLVCRLLLEKKKPPCALFPHLGAGGWFRLWAALAAARASCRTCAKGTQGVSRPPSGWQSAHRGALPSPGPA